MKRRIKPKTLPSSPLLAKWPANIAAAEERGYFTASVKTAVNELQRCDAQRALAGLVKLKPLTQMNSDDVVTLYLLNFEFARAVRDDNVAGSKSIIGRIESQLNRIARD
jgi:hypothetical protein